MHHHEVRGHRKQLGAAIDRPYDAERSGGRVDDCTRLESERPARARGFESPPLRHTEFIAFPFQG